MRAKANDRSPTRGFLRGNRISRSAADPAILFFSREERRSTPLRSRSTDRPRDTKRACLPALDRVKLRDVAEAFDLLTRFV